MNRRTFIRRLLGTSVFANAFLPSILFARNERLKSAYYTKVSAKTYLNKFYLMTRIIELVRDNFTPTRNRHSVDIFIKKSISRVKKCNLSAFDKNVILQSLSVLNIPDDELSKFRFNYIEAEWEIDDVLFIRYMLS